MWSKLLPAKLVLDRCSDEELVEVLDADLPPRSPAVDVSKVTVRLKGQNSLRDFHLGEAIRTVVDAGLSLPGREEAFRLIFEGYAEQILVCCSDKQVLELLIPFNDFCRNCIDYCPEDLRASAVDDIDQLYREVSLAECPGRESEEYLRHRPQFAERLRALARQYQRTGGS